VINIQLHGVHSYSLLFHVPLDWQSNSVAVSSCSFGNICVGLHDCTAFVSRIDKFEQLANFPFTLHSISKLSDNKGGHISIKIRISIKHNQTSEIFK